MALSSPIYINFILSSGTGARLSMVTIFSEPSIQMESAKRVAEAKQKHDLVSEIINNRRLFVIPFIFKGYFDHFDFDFLFVHGDGGVQHHAYNMGMLYLWDSPFIVIGIISLLKKIDRRILLLFLLFFLSPVPSAITTGTPHPVRAIAMIPPFQIFTGVGLVMFVFYIAKFKIKYYIFTLCFLFFIFNFLYYIHQYYVLTPIKYGYFWQYGYKEALDYAKENEAKFDKIIMTYEYDQPYIYYLFYNKIDPVWYQKNWDYNKTGETDRFKRVIGKYIFKNIDYSKDSISPKTLLIGAPHEIPESAKVIKTIQFPDGRNAFKIVEI